MKSGHVKWEIFIRLYLTTNFCITCPIVKLHVQIWCVSEVVSVVRLNAS